jgi:hypothetical protein
MVSGMLLEGVMALKKPFETLYICFVSGAATKNQEKPLSSVNSRQHAGDLLHKFETE